jgi:hypothetical protein
MFDSAPAAVIVDTMIASTLLGQLSLASLMGSPPTAPKLADPGWSHTG